MNKKLLLLLTMVFALCCQHAYAEICFGKSSKTGDIENTCIKKGSVHYDAENGILTLDNAEIDEWMYLDTEKDITINLIGENVIDVTSQGSVPIGAISVSGGVHTLITSSCGGSLKIVVNNSYYCYQHVTTDACSLTIKDCSVEMTAEELAFYGFYNGANTATLDVTIDNASFSAHVTSEKIWAKAVAGIKSLTLNDCELVSPANYHFSEGDGYLWYFDESGKEDLWFGDVIVRPKNEDDITTRIVSTTTSTQQHALYDLQGRSTSSDRVRGLYIVGGKKVLR